MTTTEIWDRLL
jgi:hypothetical protein